MRHHYVPQFLLRSWSETTADKKVQVFRVDLSDLPSTRHSPKHTGYEDNLYALSVDVVAGMEKQAIEKLYLKHVDNRAARVLQRLDAQGLKALNLDARMDWVRFLMSLRLRQPNIVLQLREESAEHLRKTLAADPDIYESLRLDDNLPTLEEWTEQRYPGLIENFGLSFFHKLIDYPKVGTKILRMKWWLWDFSNVNRDLLLADHPCIFTTGIDDPNPTS